MNRRKFLRDSAASAVSPLVLNLVGQTIVNSFIRQAAAEELIGPGDPRFYISYEMFGAPPRFCFDQWIRTSPSDLPLQRAEYTDTKFTFSGGVLSGSEPGTFLYKGMLVPHLFSTTVKVGSQTRNLSELLDQMLVIRGYATGVDGHPNNATRNIIPVGGKPSLTGCVADESKTQFGAVAWPPRGPIGAYDSRTGRSLNSVGGEDPLGKLLEGFIAPPANPAARNLQNSQKAIYDKYRSLLKAYSQTERPGSKIVGQNLQAATQLLSSSQFSDLASYWPAAVARYTQCLYDNMRSNVFPGIFDGAILNGANFANRLRMQTTEAELVKLASGFDARNVMKNVMVTHLAESFALAEYCVVRGLAHGIELFSSQWDNLNLHKDGESAPRSNFISGFDIHETGSYGALIIGSCFFRGLGAAIIELSDRLKAVNDSQGRNLWSQTALHLFAEFPRMPRTDCSGADHGFNHMSTSVFSGAITKPMVVGNVYQGGFHPLYAGTQGLSAPIAGYNQSGVPTPSMMISTISEILRVTKNPYINLAQPLIKMVGDKVEYTSIGQGITVAGGVP